MFTAHSTRGAAVSAASQLQVPVGDILRSAGWKTDNVFRKHNCKPVTWQDKTRFGRTLQQLYSSKVPK